ncbi:hypothetical protein NDU88_003785 [Pleurodeles waltl]|uniref:Uncharacterized protein n=1 Tax=Pleurodeles waltl TaxID=8319 RepID=A0AAV7RG76_PLEWA|nr:hypothetical protein NDU88_003785 [Pleurodeles waltl]
MKAELELENRASTKGNVLIIRAEYVPGAKELHSSAAPAARRTAPCTITHYRNGCAWAKTGSRAGRLRSSICAATRPCWAPALTFSNIW